MSAKFEVPRITRSEQPDGLTSTVFEDVSQVKITNHLCPACDLQC